MDCLLRAIAAPERRRCVASRESSLTGSTVIDPEIVRRMADAIFHRGPDEDGYFFRPGLAMANRRLSIVGLADGRQPMDNEDRSVSVVFNGELFDYPQIRDELIAKGHRLRTHCDTELIPHLWEEHGEGMLERLRGQFAIALWDERRRQLILARDRFGICPLYWTRQKVAGQDVLLFASEIKALLASGLVPARPDPRGINHVFTFFALPGPVTCFAGINCLLPGRYLKVFLGPRGSESKGPARVEEHVYWQIFPIAARKSGTVSAAGAVCKLASDRRVRSRHAESGRTAAAGRRSGRVLPVRRRRSERRGRTRMRPAPPRSQGPIPTYTISVQAPSLDERAEATEVAQHLGASQVVVDFRRQDVLNTYPELIRAAEAPVIDTSCAALMLLARAVHRDGYKVALTGEGADEWLAGYSWYKIHRLLGCLDASRDCSSVNTLAAPICASPTRRSSPGTRCARWKQRSAAPTPGSISMGCSDPRSCGFSAPACGSNSPTTIHTRTCSSTSAASGNGIHSTVRSIWVPG